MGLAKVGRMILRKIMRSLLVLIALFVFAPGYAQNVPVSTLEIPRVERYPEFEGFLSMKPPVEYEGRLAKISDFVQRQPKDGETPSQRTDVYLGYDDSNLYVTFVSFDNNPQGIRARLNQRGNTGDDDWVHVVLDTFQDKRRAYMFGSNPLGVQWDALWTEGQNSDTAFDTLYYTRGALTNEGFVVWMQIPFKSLRFPSEPDQTWGILFGRSIPRLNEQVFWPQYSSRVEGRLNQEGTMGGLKDISPGRNIQLLPYAGFRSYRAMDQRDPLQPHFVEDHADPDAGVDAKIVFNDSLVADVALNPDFSQVESDEPQVTTNQRFEVFFPEKRPFFLENASFFQTPMNLVFTRRIADPEFGARLTGKVGAYTVGVIAADDESPGKIVPDTNPSFGKRAGFGIFRVSRDILKQSSVGMIFTERKFNDGFNRVGGIDARFKLDRNWVAQVQGVSSATRFTNGTRQSGPAYEARLNRSGRQLNIDVNYSDRSAGFLTLAGFNPRKDIRSSSQQASYSFRPEGRYWIAMTPTITTNQVFTRGGARLESAYTPSITWEFAGQTFLTVEYRGERIRLRPSEARVSSDRDFNHHTMGGRFRTSFSKAIQIDGRYFAGADINHRPAAGREASMQNMSSADLTVTFRPVTQFTIANRYVFTKLSDRETGATIFNDHIVRSRWNWQFTRELSVRFIAQYTADIVNAVFTNIENRKSFNADFLFTYQANAWTALYVGYNGNAQNIELVPTSSGSRIAYTPQGFINDAHQFFAKFSYLIRF
jgi:hypothetical protein